MSALARRRTAGAAVALLVLFALQFVVFAAPPAAAQTDEGATTTGFLKKDISAKVGDYECENSEWHFVITGLKFLNAPESITVTFASGAVVEVPLDEVPLDKVSGHTAHYRTTEHLDDTVVSATATVPKWWYLLWDGQFNLSHGPCPKEASITIVKEVLGDGGQEEFRFSMSTKEDFFLSDGESKTFDFRWTYDAPKRITVSEHDDLLGEGWSFVDVACVDETGEPAEVDPGDWPAQVEVLLYDGGDYTCTFTNEFEETTTTSTTTTTVPSQGARITVVKEVQGEGSPEQFPFTLSTGEEFSLGDGGSESFDFEWSGDESMTVTVSEDVDSLDEGWYFVGAECVGGPELQPTGASLQSVEGSSDDSSSEGQVDVTLYDGDEYTCTFTNEFDGTTTSTTTTTVQGSTTSSTTTTTIAVPATVQGIQVTTTSTTLPVSVQGIQVTPSTTIPAVSAETLPFTGAEVGQIALFGLAALGGGGLLVYGARKRDDGDDTGATSTL